MFNPNGYDIKGVKYLPTHDGVAFTGTLYKDGKRIGSVENGGTGGPNCAHFDTREAAEAFRAWVATLGTHTYPARFGMPSFRGHARVGTVFPAKEFLSSFSRVTHGRVVDDHRHDDGYSSQW